MEETNEVKISKSTAGRDIAGRDINTYNLLKPKTYLQNLYEKFALEKETNPQLKEFIADLDYFNSTVSTDVVGLDNKLKAGKRDDIIFYAKEVKERYHKKLMLTSQYSEHGQKINVFLLAMIRSYYMTEIYPSVCAGKDETVISSLISKKIVQPLMKELGENALEFTSEDIQGMLYFLTGNCHIKWTK